MPRQSHPPSHSLGAAIWAFVTLSVVVAGWAFFFGPPSCQSVPATHPHSQSELPGTQDSVQSPSQARSEGTSQPFSNAREHNEPTTARHMTPPSSEIRRGPTRWFDAPLFQAPERYRDEFIPMRWDRSCQFQDGQSAPTELGESLRAIGLTGRAQYPKGVLVQEFTQFWQQGEEYFQLTADWEKDTPPTYRLQFYRALNPTLDEDLSPIAVEFEGKPVNYSPGIDLALTILKSKLRDAKRLGANEGMRIMLVSTTAPSIIENRDSQGQKKRSHLVRYQNEIPLQYTDGMVTCSMTASLDATHCQCQGN